MIKIDIHEGTTSFEGEEVQIVAEMTILLKHFKKALRENNTEEVANKLYKTVLDTAEMSEEKMHKEAQKAIENFAKKFVRSIFGDEGEEDE